MRRAIVVSAVLTLALFGAACAKKLDTGFPPASATAGPSTSPSASVPTTPVTAQTIIGKGIKWDLSQLLFKAGQTITVTVDNEENQPGGISAPHNFGLFDKAGGTQIFKPTKDAQPGEKVDYTIPALKAGTYYFQCDIHTNMNGTAKVE